MKPKVKKPVRRVVRWPRVDYNGAISRHKKKRMLGLLRINNKDFLVREGQTELDIKVLTVESDSIVLEYQGDKKNFMRAGS